MLNGKPETTALTLIEKSLALIQAVSVLEGTNKESVEHLLELAAENLRQSDTTVTT